ncbi:MAG: hypothetical protein AABY00_03575 [Nanoarchaeota archaeon]
MTKQTVKQIHNTLFKRKEIEYTIEADSNPGFAKATELVATELKVAPETVALKAVRGNFGTNTFLIEAFVYNSQADKEKTEPKKKVKKEAEGAK